VVGPARGFFEAGAGTVVGSLWPVEDRATRRLMVRFYQQIAGGDRSTAEALSRAQAAIAGGEAGERRRHPYYWAGFILIGDGR
jgi:CHAT domain-containing protein